MIRKFLIALSLGVTFLVTGCGQKVEVPAATVGKIMTKDGFKPGVVPTSKFRLDPCLVYCDEIVLLNVGDQAVTEQMTLFMPKDRLNMDFSLQVTLSVKESSYDDLFSRITPDTLADNQRHILLSKVYKTYAEQIIRAEAREFLSNYSINDIASNLEAVNGKLSSKLMESINKKTPFSVRYVGLSNLQYPKIIVDSQEAAAERTEKIRSENAQVELSKVILERQLQEQRMQRTIDVEKAEAEAQVNKILASSMTDRYVQYRQLSVMELMANSQNKVFIPMGMLDSVAGQIQVGK